MDISLERKPLAQIAADWLIVGLWENEGPGGAVQELDEALGGVISRLRERGDATGKAKELVPIVQPAGSAAQRVMVVGLGQRSKADVAALVTAGAAAARSITTKAHDRVAVALPEGVAGLSLEAVGVALGNGVRHGSEGPGLRKSKAE